MPVLSTELGPYGIVLNHTSTDIDIAITTDIGTNIDTHRHTYTHKHAIRRPGVRSVISTPFFLAHSRIILTQPSALLEVRLNLKS